jgi:hypothetical protein
MPVSRHVKAGKVVEGRPLRPPSGAKPPSCASPHKFGVVALRKAWKGKPSNARRTILGLSAMLNLAGNGSTPTGVWTTAINEAFAAR